MALICRQYVLRRGGGELREIFAVRLAPEERNQLEQMVRAGKGSARFATRARILLKTDQD